MGRFSLVGRHVKSFKTNVLNRKNSILTALTLSNQRSIVRALILGGRSMDNFDINTLENKIDTLIKRCDQLAVENQGLKEQQHDWPVERSRLIEQNNQAKQKIVQIISRLKSLEQAG